MANDKVTIWGGQARFGRNPAEDEYLVGDADGNFVLTPIPTPYVPPAPPIIPAFSVYSNTPQSVSAGVFTQIEFDTEEFDTNNNFASNAFTPTVAGYYQLNACVWWSDYMNGVGYIAICNGGGSSVVKYGNGSYYDQANVVSSLVYANGTTDSFTIYAYTASSQSNNADSTQTYFNGFLARAE